MRPSTILGVVATLGSTLPAFASPVNNTAHEDEQTLEHFNHLAKRHPALIALGTFLGQVILGVGTGIAATGASSLIWPVDDNGVVLNPVTLSEETMAEIENIVRESIDNAFLDEYRSDADAILARVADYERRTGSQLAATMELVQGIVRDANQLCSRLDDAKYGVITGTTWTVMASIVIMFKKEEIEVQRLINPDFVRSEQDDLKNIYARQYFDMLTTFHQRLETWIDLAFTKRARVVFNNFGVTTIQYAVGYYTDTQDTPGYYMNRQGPVVPYPPGANKQQKDNYFRYEGNNNNGGNVFHCSFLYTECQTIPGGCSAAFTDAHLHIPSCIAAKAQMDNRWPAYRLAKRNEWRSTLLTPEHERFKEYMRSIRDSRADWLSFDELLLPCNA